MSFTTVMFKNLHVANLKLEPSAMKTLLKALFFVQAVVLSASTSGQVDPCRLPPAIQEKDIAKYAFRWIIINPFSCAGYDMPPPGVKVLLYYPTRWDGKRHGVSVFGFWSSGKAWFTDGGVGGSPSHWMYVSELVSKPPTSGSLYRDGRW
jgi:hypothetical protein